MHVLPENLAILYADVSGSTRIYEKHGDQIAREVIRVGLDILREVVEEHRGRVIKSIGDELMCAFENPVDAALAARDMHRGLAEASEQNRFSIGELHIKIGWHHGPVDARGEEIIGIAPVTAQQVIRKAKADEILTSETSLALVSDELKEHAVLVDTVEAEAWQGKLNIYRVPWEEGDEEVTRFGGPTADVAETTGYQVLLLEYQGRTLRMDKDHTVCHIGRSHENELSVEGRFTSRLHAEINYRNGSFHLRDVSTNGTVVIYNDGRTLRLRREEVFLNGEGTVCFGGLPEVDPAASVHFKCIRK